MWYQVLVSLSLLVTFSTRHSWSMKAAQSSSAVHILTVDLLLSGSSNSMDQPFTFSKVTLADMFIRPPRIQRRTRTSFTEHSVTEILAKLWIHLKFRNRLSFNYQHSGINLKPSTFFFQYRDLVTWLYICSSVSWCMAEGYSAARWTLVACEGLYFVLCLHWAAVDEGSI